MSCLYRDLGIAIERGNKLQTIQLKPIYTLMILSEYL